MTKVTIGGNEYEVPVLKFKQLDVIWPRVKTSFSKLAEIKGAGPSVESADNMFSAVADCTFIIGTAMSRIDPEKTPDWVMNNLDVSEMQDLAAAVMNLMVESGLIKAGKQTAAADSTPARISTTTGMGSSPSSSPQA